MDEVIDWITICNHSRIYLTLGYVSSMQFEKSWHAAQQLKAAQPSSKEVSPTGARSHIYAVKFDAAICKRTNGRWLASAAPNSHPNFLGHGHFKLQHLK